MTFSRNYALHEHNTIGKIMGENIDAAMHPRIIGFVSSSVCPISHASLCFLCSFVPNALTKKWVRRVGKCKR